MVLSMAGVDVDIKNSGAYIKSWLKALKDDKSLIFSAAAKASQASARIIGEDIKEEVSA
jgi:antirestriction protein ArdC